MVLVNSVVISRAILRGSDQLLAVALAVYGAGSIIAALALPAIVERHGDRMPMIWGGAAMVVVMMASAWFFLIETPLMVFFALWLAMGLAYSTILTPAGRLLKRSTHVESRAEIFTAQFVLSHACWLITYPLAGWLGAQISISAAFAILGGLGCVSIWVAMRVWPTQTNGVLEHDHPDLAADHPHLIGSSHRHHRHAFIIDELHPHWPQHR